MMSEYMDPDVRLIEMSTNAEELVCKCARNDYFDGKIWQHDFETIMEDVDGDTINEKKYNLLEKLLLRGHFGPYEHPHMTLWFRVSRSCMGQITRHRHVTFDIQSQRYVDFSERSPVDPDDFLFPPGIIEEDIATREGRKEFDDIEDHGTHTLTMRQRIAEAHYEDALERYRDLRDMGVPAEDARQLLPIGTKVNITATMNLRTAFHILVMRGSGDAQKEIQLVSDGIRGILKEQVPTIMRAWDENEQKILRQKLAP